MRGVICITLACIAAVVGFPQQKEGLIYKDQAIAQAHSSQLLPNDAEIQNVQEGIELGAYEGIPGNQPINLFEILGDQVPPEVVNNLQSQLDKVGSNK